MKKILAAFCFIAWLFALLFAIFAPFISAWFFLFSFVVALIALPYGFKIQDWIFKTLFTE